jgi:hypothetical protein
MSQLNRRDEIDANLAVRLGVSELEPGYACIRVAPTVSGIGSESGIVDLPIGPVLVSSYIAADFFSLDVEVPIGIHLQVRLPAGRNDGLYVNGEPIAEDTQTVRTDDYVELAVLPGSRYHFEVRGGADDALQANQPISSTE